jgi:putative membrane protein
MFIEPFAEHVVATQGLTALGLVVPLDQIVNAVVATVIFSILGLALFGVAFFLIVQIAPFSIRKELADDQNTALAIVIGSVILGIAIIVAAAVNG